VEGRVSEGQPAHLAEDVGEARTIGLKRLLGGKGRPRGIRLGTAPPGFNAFYPEPPRKGRL